MTEDITQLTHAVLQKAFRKCYCRKCKKDMLAGDWRVEFEQPYQYYHVKCYLELIDIRIKELTNDLAIIKEAKELKEEKDYLVLRAI